MGLMFSLFIFGNLMILLLKQLEQRNEICSSSKICP